MKECFYISGLGRIKVYQVPMIFIILGSFLGKNALKILGISFTFTFNNSEGSVVLWK